MAARSSGSPVVKMYPIYITVEIGVAYPEQEVVTRLLAAHEYFVADGDGVLVAHGAAGDGDVVVNAVEVGAFGALEGGAVDLGAMAVVTAVVTGLGPGGFVQGEKEDLGRVDGCLSPRGR
jgi:hypothetical protein